MSNVISKDDYIWPENCARNRQARWLTVFDALKMIIRRRKIEGEINMVTSMLEDSLCIKGIPLKNFIRFAERHEIPQPCEVYNELVDLVGQVEIEKMQDFAPTKPAHKPKTKKRKNGRLSQKRPCNC